MFEMSPLCVNTSSQQTQPLSQLADSSVNNVLMQSAPDINQSLFEFVNIVDATFVHTLLHYTPDLVVDWVQVRTVRWPQIRSDEVGCLSLQQLDSLRGRRTVLLEDCDRLDGRKYLLREQDIAVILAFATGSTKMSPVTPIFDTAIEVNDLLKLNGWQVLSRRFVAMSFFLVSDTSSTRLLNLVIVLY